MFFLLLAAFIGGMVVDNLFAPKVRFENGQMTVTWTDKRKNKTP